MRLFSLLLLPVLFLSLGCAITPGRSPSQIEAAHASAGYAERDYGPMQAIIP